MAVGMSGRVGSAVLAAGSLSVLAPGAFAASPSFFPTSQPMVPFVVAGAFALPAVVASLFVALSRLGRVKGPLLGLGLIALAIAAAVGYAQPELIGSLRG